MRFLLALLVFLSMSTMAEAAQYFVGIGVAQNDYADQRHLDNDTMLNGVLGYQFSDQAAVELLYGNTDTFYSYTGDMIYYMHHSAEGFRPYVLGGLGVTSQEEAGVGNTTLLAVNAGLGLEYLFSSHIRFFTDVRDIYSPSGGKNDGMLNIGILFSFDRPAPLSVVPQADQGFYQLEVG